MRTASLGEVMRRETEKNNKPPGQRRWERRKSFVSLFEPLAWLLVRVPGLDVALSNQGLKRALVEAQRDLEFRRRSVIEEEEKR